MTSVNINQNISNKAENRYQGIIDLISDENNARSYDK